MPSSFPGYVKPQNVGLDAGVLYVGGVGMGASVGGFSFDPGRTVRNIPFDGKTSGIVALDRVLDYSTNKLSATIIDFSAAALMRYEPGSTSDGSASNTVTPIDAQTIFVVGDYLQDVEWIMRNSSGGSTRIKMAWALVQKYTVKSTDKDEVKAAIEITAQLAATETDLNKCPYVWITSAS